MFRFHTTLTTKASPLCAFLLCAALTPGQAQGRAASPAPLVIGPQSAPRPALVPFSFRGPNGKMTTIQLRRLPASCVVRDTPPAAGSSGAALPGPLRARAARRGATAASIAPAGTPQPALVSDPQLFNSQLDYSHDRNADTGWIFPTRGYDLRNSPGGFRVSLNSLIYPTDPAYAGSDNLSHAYDNFGAKVELIQLGRPAQISTMRVSMGVARETRGATNPIVNLNPPGGVAVILFWDGVYNDLNNGFPRDASGGLRLAQDGAGASGALIQMGQGFSDYTIFFDNDGSGTTGRFRITDPKGRLGLTVAAVYDPNAGDVDGVPLSTREDGVYLRPGASVGQNKYFLISDGNLDIGTPSYDGNGVATTQNTLGFAPGGRQRRYFRRHGNPEFRWIGRLSGRSGELQHQPRRGAGDYR